LLLPYFLLIPDSQLPYHTLHTHLFSALARYAVPNQVHLGPTAPPSPTSLLYGQAVNAAVQLTPRNAADKTPLAVTAVPHVLKQLAGNVSKCVIREGMAARLLGEWGIVLL
jgi:hypothetical protein